MSWWWLSFCDPDLPKGSQFLGGCYSQGSNIVDAAFDAHLHGCNPGGEVMGLELPHDPPEAKCYRLLSISEIEDAVPLEEFFSGDAD